MSNLKVKVTTSKFLSYPINLFSMSNFSPNICTFSTLHNLHKLRYLELSLAINFFKSLTYSNKYKVQMNWDTPILVTLYSARKDQAAALIFQCCSVPIHLHLQYSGKK